MESKEMEGCTFSPSISKSKCETEQKYLQKEEE